jgi:hypothetical protein
MALQAVDKYDAVIELDCSYGLCGHRLTLQPHLLDREGGKSRCR